MAHFFPATFISHSTGRVESHILKLEVDQTNVDLIGELMKLPTGTPLILVAYEIDKEQIDIPSLVSNENEMRNRLMSRLHTRLKEYAEESGVEMEKIRDLLKLKLRALKIINESLSEMDEESTTKAIYILETQFNPRTFNYEPYKETNTEDN